mmetsp:Transcript_30673/g.63776  ORF Transcript_30673/g.63776 Transcript_30673/m.63776 type:complete len:90 (-) Transcript_30673:78-347(-)
MDFYLGRGDERRRSRGVCGSGGDSGGGGKGSGRDEGAAEVMHAAVWPPPTTTTTGRWNAFRGHDGVSGVECGITSFDSFAVSLWRSNRI